MLPFVLQGHETSPDDAKLDVDWTLSDNLPQEERLRLLRNEMIKENLLEGRNAQYRSSGNSLVPFVKPNDRCTYAPVTREEDVQLKDIVFCQVQPRNYFYAHLVTRKERYRGGRVYFAISTAKGHDNGCCYIEHIYGKLIKVKS